MHSLLNTDINSGTGRNIKPISSRPTDGMDYPMPTTILGTGLSQQMLEELLAKKLLESGLMDQQSLIAELCLTGPVVQAIIELFRADGRIEVKSPELGKQSLRYSLTQSGRSFALDASLRSGYVGPAPVPLSMYHNLIRQQSVKNNRIEKNRMQAAFSDLIIDGSLLNQLGAAMHSGKAVFVYGPPGTGKTYICQRLTRMLGNPVFVPYAIAVGDAIVSLFDTQVHRPIETTDATGSLYFTDQIDSRLQLCERPFITSGGELTGAELEIQYDPSTRQYTAPIHVQASNGMYLIDDLGRQRIPATQLFNRWIVPMESGIDYLSLQNGARMEVPFDMVLIFSTNLDPADLADAAFLRRIGHKIEFEYLDKEKFRRIWQGVCSDLNTHCDSSLVEYVIEEIFEKNNIPMMACHPRDLINLAMDHVKFEGESDVMTIDSIHFACKSNFLNFGSGQLVHDRKNI